MIRVSRLLLSDILLLKAVISNQNVTIKTVDFFGACTVGLFEYLSPLMLTCAQSGRVKGLERKTEPASSERRSRKGLKDKNNGLLGFVIKFCIPFGRQSTISICGGSTVTVLTLSVLLIILPNLVFLYRFSVKKTVNRPVFRVKLEIF